MTDNNFYSEQQENRNKRNKYPYSYPSNNYFYNYRWLIIILLLIFVLWLLWTPSGEAKTEAGSTSASVGTDAAKAVNAAIDSMDTDGGALNKLPQLLTTVDPMANFGPTLDYYYQKYEKRYK